MIAITAATGHLGQLVIDSLLRKVPASGLVAIVRNPAKASGLAARGVAIRQADYSDGSALDKALAGVEKLLLVSSSEIGQRIAQHGSVIAAAKRAGVQLLVYTSVLHADRTPLNLAPEHLGTEALIKDSGIPFIVLRNGWYTENYTASVPTAVLHGVFVGSAGSGRISSAARLDFAEAAAAVLTNQTPPAGKIYELAGDQSYTLADFAAEISRQTGKDIPYVNLPESEYRDLLIKAGLPEVLAAGLASWDTDAAGGALFDDQRQLSQLIGRPTTPLAESIRQALKS